jgi:flagellar protein FlaI
MGRADGIQHNRNAGEVSLPVLQGINTGNKNSKPEEIIALLADVNNDAVYNDTIDDLKSRIVDDHLKLITDHGIDFDANNGWEQKIRNAISSKELNVESSIKVAEEEQVPLHQRLIALISNKEEKEEEYNIAVHGPIVDFSIPEGSNFKEIEMYAVNPPYAYVRMAYDPFAHEYQYQVLEPLLSEDENKLLNNIKQQLIETLELNLKETDHKNAEKYLRKHINQYLREYKIDISVRKKERVMYHLIRDFLGFGRIDAIMRDMRLEDVSCDGPNTPLYLYHKAYNSIPTNVIFSDDDELDSFAIRIAQLCGRHISIANPLLDATMPDGSRIQITLGREVTTRGSTFTIRRFNESPLTPANLVNFHTFSTAMMAYLWMAVDSSKSIVFVGGTASGKTTAMNAVSLFIQPEMKIVSIEDTRELNLSHPNWIPGVTRESFAGEERGSIQMYELLRASLRQRPEYILVGEVRGAEAYVLFQAMSTGHTTFSTMHADSVQSVVHRLENPPINVPRIMIQALNIVSIQAQVKVNDERVRRCKSLTEIVGVDPRTGELLTNEVFIWDAVKDSFQYSGRSYILESIMENRGWNEEKLKDELQKRQDLLEWARLKKISHYKDFAKLVVTYGREPETIMMTVRQDLND